MPLLHSVHAETQFTGKDFLGSGIDSTLPIPATLLNAQGEPTNDLSRANMVFIGEALSPREDQERKPFRGSTGTDLRFFCKMAGLPILPTGTYENRPFYELPNVYLDNVIKIRPEDNDLTKLPPGALEFWIDVLHRQLMSGAFNHVNVIVAIGPLATWALTGNAYIKNAGKKGKLKLSGITHWRGSVLETHFVCGRSDSEYPAGRTPRRLKVIPTLTPSYVQNAWSVRYQLIHDLALAKKEQAFPEVRKPERNFLINPTIEQIEAFADQVEALDAAVGDAYTQPDGTVGWVWTDPYPNPDHCISADFETKPPYLRSVGFSLNNRDAICIPFSTAWHENLWPDAETEARVWRAVARILWSRLPKIGQNWQTYDDFYSRFYGMPTRNFWGDTRYMHKALHPELQSKLEVLTSIYTYPVQNFYKEEGKIQLKGKKNENFSQDQFFEYNCTDVVCPHEIAFKLRDELIAVKRPFGGTLWDTYVDRYLTLGPHLMDLTMRGAAWDVELAQSLAAFYEEMIKNLNDHLTMLIGHPLNVKSPLQMKNLLYKELALPPVYTGHGKKRRITTGADALYKLRAHFPTRGAVITCILHILKARTRLSNTIRAKHDKRDRRMRGSYSMGTETGRLNSTKNPFSTGRNMQNFERVMDTHNAVTNMRNLIITTRPRQRMILEGDYRQIEAMFVAWLANEPNLINLFLTGADIHTANAMMIFREPANRITKKMRYLGKVTSHGANYDMGAGTLVENIIKQTEGELRVKKSEAEMMLETYHGANPGIRERFHQWIRDQLDATMTLWTPPPFQRRRIFFGKQFDLATYREAYANIPQSIAPDLSNDAIKKINAAGEHVFMQTHDSVVCEFEREEAPRVFKAMVNAMRQPISLYPFCPHACKEPLMVPVDFGVGPRLGSLTELKKMEDEEVIEYLMDKTKLPWVD